MSNVLIFPEFNKPHAWFEPFNVDQAIANLKLKRNDVVPKECSEEYSEFFARKIQALQIIKDSLLHLSDMERYHIIHYLLRIGSGQSTGFIVEISRDRMPKKVLEETNDNSYEDMGIELSLLVGSYYEDRKNPWFCVTLNPNNPKD